MAASLLLLACWLAGPAIAQPPATPVGMPPALLFPEPSPEDKAAAERELAAELAVVAQIDPRLIRAQARAAAPAGRDDTQPGYRIPFELPGPERLFRADSEEALFQRMRQEARERKPEELVFPEEPVLSKEPYYGRDWPKVKMVVEPHFVCHGRLHFEELNTERYGWELGVLQPLLSSLDFYKNVALLPYHVMTYPCRCYDCSSGKCLPGDPVPLMLYPPDLTVTGTLGEAAVIAALVAIFP